MMKRLLRIWVTLFFLPASLSFSQEFPFTHYTQDNEIVSLPSADVRTVYQDRLGYIWFVVYSSGLLRYNGHKTDLYTQYDGLPDLTVWQVLEDHLGRLWVATNVGLAVSRKPLREYAGLHRIEFSTRIGATELIKTTIIENRMAVDTKGKLWVGTREEGIIRYRFSGVDSVLADTIKTNILDTETNQDVRSIIVRRDGSIWVGVGGGNLLMFDQDSPQYEVLAERDGVPRFETDVLYETRSGKLWGGCRNGLLWRLSEGSVRPRIEAIRHEFKNRITSIIEAPAGTLWVGSDGSGVMQLTEQSAKSSHDSPSTHPIIYTQKNGYLSDIVRHIIEDEEGNIWFAQLGGVSKLRANFAAFRNYTAKSHTGENPILSNPAINAVVPPIASLPSSGIWIGTSGGGISLLKENGEVKTIQTESGLKSNWVNALTLDEKGRLWIGTETGMNCLSLDSKLPPPKSPTARNLTLFDQNTILSGYEYNSIFACKNVPLREDKNGKRRIESIWFPAYRVLYCFVDNEWFLFRAASGLPATAFHAVAFDDEGRLWVGTRDGGLFRSKVPLTLLRMRELPAQDIDYLPEEGRGRFGREIISPIFEPVWNRLNGAPSNQIETIIWRDGALWVGTPEGLAVIAGEPLRMTTHLTVKDGLRANNITSMAFSPVMGTLWVGTNGGLAEIDPKSRKVIRTVTKQDGLVDNEVWFYGSVVIDAEGTVYFGTAKGLSIYRPQLDQPNPILPTLRLEQADFTENNSGNNEIELEYAALSFANEKLVRYKTRLVGYDKGWSKESAEAKIRYTNLSAFLLPKEYSFEVLACNNAGLWTNTPLRHAFSVQPPWWFRWWWLLLNLVLLIVFIYGFSRYRLRQLEKRSRELEKTVQERTEEIRQQAQELREKNTEIIKTQNQLITQEKLASLGALTAGVAHEIRNPLNFVNNFAALSKDLTQTLRQYLNKPENGLPPQELAETTELLDDLQQNVTKINEHGKRIDNIVRGMLLLSQGTTGERFPTAINVLLDEHVQLAYHGLLAQDASFDVAIKTDYDQSIGVIEVVPQDISRVFLNIVNNAYYAANEKRKIAPPPFAPTVFVSTRNSDDHVEIRIRDNGNGIPKDIVDKIFNPFFTTKPAGKGTGLGLSLSYDVVVKQHKGELEVETKEGEYTEFIVTLPKIKK